MIWFGSSAGAFVFYWQVVFVKVFVVVVFLAVA